MPCLCKIFSQITIDSVQYLGWISAIVATILSLTTIIFSQFNERVVEKSNDIVESIKTKVFRENLETIKDEIISELNKMFYLLKNDKIYKKTMKFFKVLSYSLVFLWFIGSIGYAIHNKTLPDKLIVVISTLILMALLLFIPHIFSLFAKDIPLNLDKSSDCTLGELGRFFTKISNVHTKEIVKMFLQPLIQIKLNENNNIMVNISQRVPVGGYKLITKIDCGNEGIIYLKLLLKKGENIFNFVGIEQYLSFVGVFNEIRDSNLIAELFVYEKEQLKSVFNIKKVIENLSDQETVISYRIGNSINKNILKVNKVAANDENLLIHEKKDSTNEYKLKNI